jgi:hypothetical protein
VTMYEFLSVGIAFLFVAGVLAGAMTTLGRVAAYRRQGVTLPKLLVRDAIVFTGFSVTIALILMVRALGAGPLVVGQVWWLLATSIPCLVSVFTYLYVEVFVIDQRRGE